MAATLTGALSTGLLLPEAGPLATADATGADDQAPPPTAASEAAAFAHTETARASRSHARTSVRALEAAEVAQQTSMHRKLGAAGRAVAVRAAAQERAKLQRMLAKKRQEAARKEAARKAAARAVAARKAARQAAARKAATARVTTSSRVRAVSLPDKSQPSSTPSTTNRGIPSRVAALNWDALADCEATGNPRAVNPSGQYFGLYQFDTSTWRSVGGSGLPTSASSSEQTYRAQLLYMQRGGASAWPACGVRL